MTRTEPVAEPRWIGSSKPASSVPSSRPSRMRSTRSINDVILGMGQLRDSRSVWQAASRSYISSHQVPPTGSKWLKRLPAAKA